MNRTLEEARKKLQEKNYDPSLANYLYDVIKEEKGSITQFNEKLEEILKGRPIQYVIGNVDFYGYIIDVVCFLSCCKCFILCSKTTFCYLFSFSIHFTNFKSILVYISSFSNIDHSYHLPFYDHYYFTTKKVLTITVNTGSIINSVGE